MKAILSSKILTTILSIVILSCAAWLVYLFNKKKNSELTPERDNVISISPSKISSLREKEILESKIFEDSSYIVKGRDYIIENRGETLSSISKKEYGHSYMYQSIISFTTKKREKDNSYKNLVLDRTISNDLVDIRRGDKIYIPSKDELTNRKTDTIVFRDKSIKFNLPKKSRIIIQATDKVEKEIIKLSEGFIITAKKTSNSDVTIEIRVNTKEKTIENYCNKNLDLLSILSSSSSINNNMCNEEASNQPKALMFKKIMLPTHIANEEAQILNVGLISSLSRIDRNSAISELLTFAKLSLED